MQLQIKSISKSYQQKEVLNDISFSLETGELLSIIGPSGSGKTTLLKIIAQLENQDKGQIKYQFQDFKQHPVVLVFQDYYLFPHLTVFDNLAFGLKVRKISKHKIKEQVNQMLRKFHLADKRHFFPNQLSAGQKQRIAIARALMINPSILLLDEPFANLDKNLKIKTADFIKTIQQEFKITMICVTHDQEEAFFISDRVAIMLDGKIKQIDSVKNIYYSPKNLQIARFLGPVNIIPNRIYPFLQFSDYQYEEYSEIYARAESIQMQKNKKGKAKIIDYRFVGHYILYTVELNQLQLKIYSISEQLEKNELVDLIVTHYILPERNHS
ncbi:MAG: ABC transporter ATP-binding protein [Spirochaetes bacterium]|nr:ABC transporter ATP-binding protein [Spirochaetota bacterium]